jgi:hypothetical protein
MGQISILRPKRNLVSILVDEAVYCESCACVSNSVGGCCGLCGNIPVWPLAEFVPQPPKSPLPEAASGVRMVPVMRLELARAARPVKARQPDSNDPAWTPTWRVVCYIST